jgi:hypothetical protein
MWRSIRARRRRKQEGWDIQRRWKEEVVYWEGQHGFILDGAWGVTPPKTFAPDAATWDEATPEWLHGRRDEVVGRLKRAPFRHVVVEENASHWGDPGRRVVTRP